MNVAVMKTKAEQSFCETFDRVADRLPGNDDVRSQRRDAIGRFAALGLPHRRIEEWKYTDLRNAVVDAAEPSIDDETSLTIADLIVALGPLAKLDAYRITFINGRYSAELSTPEVVDGLEVMTLSAGLETGAVNLSGDKEKDAVFANDAVVALNTAYAADGAAVKINDGTTLSKPIIIAHVLAGAEAKFTATRNVVTVGSGAKATIVEAFVTLPGAAAGWQENVATDISLADDADVTHVKCTAPAVSTTHLSNWMLSLGANTRYAGFQLTQGSALARNQVYVKFNGEHSDLDLSGVFLGSGDNHIDTTLLVDHAVPHCNSRELFKGVLDDRARGIFQAKVVVQPEAQKTDGKQMAQALMLSPDAEFDSKPELEIYADDVACGHGSTCVEIDSDLLFYCRSRGIPENEAHTLLIESFIGEALAQVEDDEIRGALSEVARQWLSETQS